MKKSDYSFVILVLFIILGLLMSGCDYKGEDTEAACPCVAEQIILNPFPTEGKYKVVVRGTGNKTGVFNFGTDYLYQVGDTVIR